MSFLFAASVLLALGVGGCATGPAEEDPAEGPARTSEAAPGVTDTVEVILDEYVIVMPSRLVAGPTVFRLVNEGREDHNFLVDRDGSRAGVEDPLSPGETAHVILDLEAGRYTMLCTWAGHDSRGMFTQVRVEPSGSP